MKIKCPECNELIDSKNIDIFDEPNQYLIMIECNNCDREFQADIDFDDLDWDEL